ncbi:MAG: 23S rRNA pseudouridine(2605) synthase RluB [Pseudomonadota bacterium]
MADRAQKVLAAAGYGSRRGIEKLIAAGELTIDGRVAKLGDTISGGEALCLRGKPISIAESQSARHRYLMYHKPAGQVCTRSDPEGRPTIFDALPEPGQRRWISIGRLDIATTGLLLLTTDGELANRLMHPSYEVRRDYAVRVVGEPGPDVIGQLREGVMLEDGKASFADIQAGGGSGLNRWFDVSLHEGRNREVRRIWEAVGFTVSRLVRTGYGPVALPARLGRSRFRDLNVAEVKALYAAVTLEVPQTVLKFFASRKRQGKKPQGRRFHR